jgi:hypothetical protein
LGGYKITNLAAGTAAADAVRFSQLQGGSASTYITAAGTDTITGTVTPTLTAYTTGQQFSFVVAATNTTAVTLNIDSVGAKAVTRTGSVALVAGDMIIGQVVIVEYDGTRFQLINGNNLRVAGTTSGIATIVTPAVAGTPTITLPSVSGTLAIIFTPITASLGSDVALNNIANYFDGPTVAQGTSGTWFVSGTVTINDTLAASVLAKLWDGTTVIASAGAYVALASQRCSISLSGFITGPVGNLRISVRDNSNTSGNILANNSGNAKDSTITAIRIA